MNKTLVRILAVILAILMAGSLLISVLSSLSADAATLSQAQLDALKYFRGEIQQEQDEIAAEINSLEYQQFSVLERKEVLDEEIDLIQQEIDNIEAQTQVFEQYLIDKEAEVEAFRQAEQDQFMAFQERIRAMEENGFTAYFLHLLAAESVPDFIQRLDLVLELVEYDNEVYAQLNEARQATENAIAELEEAKQDQLVIAAEVGGCQFLLDQKVAEASALIADVQQNYSLYPEEYDEIVTAENALQREVDEMVAEVARQEAATNADEAVAATRSFIWPSVESRIVTTQFGTQLDPEYGHYTTHYGIDIAVNYGSQVLAADTGSVVAATYDPAYGYYILLNHGNGRSTLYAHLSRIDVEEGSTVIQGHPIALSGSTGATPQPHLHFEVRVEGLRVNPLTQYSNYSFAGAAGTALPSPSPSPEGTQGN